MPVSATVAVAAGFFFPAAVKVAVTVPGLAGANRTLTVQDLPGRRLLRVQVSPVMENAAAPANRSRSGPRACPAAIDRTERVHAGQPNPLKARKAAAGRRSCSRRRRPDQYAADLGRV